jgi:hypothetical protein
MPQDINPCAKNGFAVYTNSAFVLKYYGRIEQTYSVFMLIFRLQAALTNGAALSP